MPPRDPRKVQLDFPLLVSDLINQLQLVGTIGLLDFSPVVQPTFIVGSRGLTIEAEPVVFAPAEVFDGAALNPAATTVIVDTGPLPAGDYDLNVQMNLAITVGVVQALLLSHRDAADAADLSIWRLHYSGATQESFAMTIALSMAENQRFIIRNETILTGRAGGTIAIKRRVAP